MRFRLCLLNIPYSCANENLIRELIRDVDLDVVNVPFPPRTDAALKLRSWHPVMNTWKRRYDRAMDRAFKSARMFQVRSGFAAGAIECLEKRPDAILQIGGLFSPGVDDIPYATYNDFTTALAAREYPPWAPFRGQKAAESWYEREQALYRGAARVFTLSNYTRSSVIDDYGVSSEKVVTVGAGGNIAQPPDRINGYDGRTVIFVGLDFERKGGKVLLEAFKLVRSAKSDARLIIVGPELKDPPQGVISAGEVRDKSQLLSLYQRASVFVMPSLCEPFGFVFLEAMACGLPCIGTTNDAMPEIIENGNTGRVVPPNSPFALASAILDMLGSPAVLESMGERARKRVFDHFTWELTAKRIVSEFQQVL